MYNLEKNLGWLNMFEGSEYNFTIGLSFVMIIIDCLIIAALIFIFDAIISTDDSPKFFSINSLKKVYFNKLKI